MNQIRISFAVSMMGITLASINSVRASDDVKPQAMLLWPQGAPGAVGEEEKDKPSLTVYLPPADKANGAAVVICPGGGYGLDRKSVV